MKHDKFYNVKHLNTKFNKTHCVLMMMVTRQDNALVMMMMTMMALMMFVYLHILYLTTFKVKSKYLLV